MVAVYDDAARHVDSLPGDVLPKAAATHIGLFFAWAAAAGLVSDIHASEHSDDFDKLTRRWYSGRDYVRQALGGTLTAEHLSEEGQAFATAYYEPGIYRQDYEEVLLGHHPSIFHVRDDRTNYEQLAPLLTKRLDAFRAGRPLATATSDLPAPRGERAPAVSGALPLEAADGWPAPISRGDGAPPIAQPPPLPPRVPKSPPPLPRRSTATARGRRKKGGTGKYWLLAVLLLYLALKGCGLLIDASKEGRQRDGTRHWAEEILRRKQMQQERADRVREQIEARTNVDQIRKARWAPLSADQEMEAQASGLPLKFENALGMRFVLVPSGSFVMGSPGSEEGRSDDEELHNVEFSEPFHMLTTEVSISLWSRYDETAKVKAKDHARPGTRSRPATAISYEQAAGFCRWLEERDPERTYRLPTEAEWEYACRAGTQDRFWWGEDAYVAVSFANVADARARQLRERRARAESEAESYVEWFSGDDGHAGVAVVGSYRANPWGLYDMLGNASEWCRDWYGRYDVSQFQDPTGPTFGTRRILRGGSCASSISMTRCASRQAVLPTHAADTTGFRVVSRPRR